MKGVNKVILLGNVGKDPEMKVLATGTSVAAFSMATTKFRKDKQTGARQEMTEWHNCKAFGRLAEIIGEWVIKGSKIYVEGELQTSSWDDRDTGKKMYRTEIVVNEMQMLDSKEASPSPAQQQQGVYQPQTFNDDVGF